MQNKTTNSVVSISVVRLVTKSTPVGFACQNWFSCIFWLVFGHNVENGGAKFLDPWTPCGGSFCIGGGPELTLAITPWPRSFPGLRRCKRTRHRGVQWAKKLAPSIFTYYDPKPTRICNKINPTGGQVGLDYIVLQYIALSVVVIERKLRLQVAWWCSG